MKNHLSFIENSIYFTGWTVACLYSLYKLFQAQTDILENNPEIPSNLTDLYPGWRFLRRQRDESDVEWSSWKFLIKISWFYMLLQFLISEIIRRTYLPILKHWYLISSVVFIVYNMGFKQLAIILIQPIVYCGIIYYGGKRMAIWVTSIILLVLYNSIKYKSYLWQILDSEYDEEVFLILYAIPWLELRCISFSIDHIEQLDKIQHTKYSNYMQNMELENILSMFSYVLYLPVFFVGPIILYEEFERSFQVRNGKLWTRLKIFVWNMLLYIIYTLILDLAFHYIYFFAMQSNIKAIEMLPSIALCGGGLWMGLQFHLKYVVSYGTTTSYAKLDHIAPPPTPRCIVRIHLYSQMWRYFDVGLYRFLVKYIHVPVYNTMKDLVTVPKLYYKLISAFITFTFIFMWHGTTWNILVWAFLNYVGIMLEQISQAIGETNEYKWFKEKVLKAESVESRFIALLCAPLLVLSAISNFYLFGSSEVGDLYIGLLKSPSLFNSAIVAISFYCSCNICAALKDIPSRTDVKKVGNNKSVSYVSTVNLY